MKRAIVPLLLGIALLAGGAHAQGKKGKAAAWIYLGEANVDGAADHDRITVGRDEGTFRSIQLRVERAPIDFDRVVVHYRDGEDDKLPLRDTIREGGQTRAIDLEGRNRVIQSVEIWYQRAKLGAGKPRVTLYGRR
jgi:hypothetical protein